LEGEVERDGDLLDRGEFLRGIRVLDRNEVQLLCREIHQWTKVLLILPTPSEVAMALEHETMQR
jgi:hypothetical protein